MFWWFYRSSNSSLGHSYCFFGHVWLPFYGLDCCPRILGVLGSNYSHICHLFPIGWLVYFSKCSNICSNEYFFILDGTMKCLRHVTLGCLVSCFTLWKLSGLVFPPIVGFFGRLLTQTKVYFPSSRHSFEYRVNMFLSKGKCLVINLSHHTNISFIIGPLSYNITYSSWLATSYNGPPFTVSVWHTIDNLGTHLLQCPSGSECTIAHDTFRDIVATIALESRAHV
jgi:hypothetical protein